MRVEVLLSLLPLAFAAPASRAPLHIPRDAEPVKGKYIVKMKTPEVSAFASTESKIKSCLKSVAADADFVYKQFGGFAGSLTDEEVEKLRDNPDVEYIEQDSTVTAFATTSQSGAPWGLARLSSSKPGSTSYKYDDTAGAGTCAYVIDTGIDTNHPEFEGRAQAAKSFVPGSNTDDNGHGTHVAGTIGSRTYGVAKKTSLFGVKVLDSAGDGKISYVLAGMDYVISDVASRNCPKGVVVNMSLGINQVVQSINDAAARIVRANLFLAVAAGNGDPITFKPVNAGGVSPASETSACTVGATDRNDRVGSFSNFGAVVDVHAPGVDILSTLPDGRTGTQSGTSMATPHVAGLAAYFLSLDATTTTEACSYMAGLGSRNIISGVPSGTANVLVQNGVA